MEKDFNQDIERLLEMPYWVIDFLPMQVPEGGGGQFFAVEQYYMKEPQYDRLCRQFGDVMLRLSCYYDMLVSIDGGDEWLFPDPGMLEKWLASSLRHGNFYALIKDEDALITASSGDTNMTLYNPSPALLDLARQLANAAGLFLWRPE